MTQYWLNTAIILWALVIGKHQFGLSALKRREAKMWRMFKNGCKPGVRVVGNCWKMPFNFIPIQEILHGMEQVLRFKQLGNS